MQIRFAETRPSGDYALVLPVAGKDRTSLGSLGPAQQSVVTTLDRQRFEGDAAAVSEQFAEENGTHRRLLIVGVGPNGDQAAEKLGGTAVARLLTSGEKKAVIDVSGYDADKAARVGLAAALRSWRHDRYRTKLKDNQKPSLDEVVIVGLEGSPSMGVRVTSSDPDRGGLLPDGYRNPFLRSGERRPPPQGDPPEPPGPPEIVD